MYVLCLQQQINELTEKLEGQAQQYEQQLTMINDKVKEVYQ